MDPASKSTGWALFDGGKLKEHGTVAAEGAVPFRLFKIFNEYRYIIAEHEPAEVHVENFRKNLAIQLHWSVGVIMAAAGFVDGVEAFQDCWMSSWQRWSGFKKGKGWGVGEKFRGKVKSEDEVSAILIGLWWTRELRSGVSGASSGTSSEIRSPRRRKRKKRKHRRG